MISPAQIKRALSCIGMHREEYACASCPYRSSQSCAEDVVNDAKLYIAQLEQRANLARTGREGRIRTVYLYTITDPDGKIVCKDATQIEAARAMGYENVSAIQYLYGKQERGGNMNGVVITRRKGIVGAYSSASGVREERRPYVVYKVTDAEGRTLMDGVNAKDVAARYGITVQGLASAFHSVRERIGLDASIIEYRGEKITRIKTERGKRCGI